MYNREETKCQATDLCQKREKLDHRLQKWHPPPKKIESPNYGLDETTKKESSSSETLGKTGVAVEDVDVDVDVDSLYFILQAW